MVVTATEGAGAASAAAPAIETPQIVQRLASLPGVSSTLSCLHTFYDSYGKNSDIGLVKKAVETAESTAIKISSAAMPLIDPYMGKIDALDKYTCDKFDKLSLTVVSTTGFVRELPKKVNTTLTETTSAAMTTIASINAQSVEDAAIATLDGLYERKERAVDVLQGTATTTVQRIEAGVAGVTARVLDVADMIVDVVVPAPDSTTTTTTTITTTSTHGSIINAEGEADTRTFAEVTAAPAHTNARPKIGAETAKVLAKARSMTSKVQARLYARAMSQVRFAQRRSADVVEVLRPYTVDLIKYAEGLVDEAHALDADDAPTEWDAKTDASTTSTTTTTTTGPFPPASALAKSHTEQLAQKLQATSRQILVKALHAAIRSRRWATEKVAVVRLRLHLDTLKPIKPADLVHSASDLVHSASDLVHSARMQVFSVTNNASKLVHERVLALQPVIPDLASKVTSSLRASVDHVYELYEEKHLVAGLLEDLESAKEALVEVLRRLPLGSYLVLNKDDAAEGADPIIAYRPKGDAATVEVLSFTEVSLLEGQEGEEGEEEDGEEEGEEQGEEGQEGDGQLDTSLPADNANFMDTPQ